MKRLFCTSAVLAGLLTVPAVFSQTDKGDKLVADPAATKLFKDARDARAVWTGFPGFKAELTVNHNGQLIKAKLAVQENGKVILDIPDLDTKKFVREQIASLVGHRLPGGTEKDPPCAFASKNDTHPLGRKIIVLGDATGASYRIKDNQLLEVNRDMKAIRFTITVMKNYITPEKKFLASEYVVNTWSNKTNQLLSSWTYHHTWKRHDKFDLPATVTIVIARAGAPMKVLALDPAVPQPGGAPAESTAEPVMDVWSLTFANVALLTSK